MLIGGRLAHDEVADVMPVADTFAMTSTWPESFGMVPAESAACGVPPVSADHSGMREVSELLAEALDPELAPLLSFPVGPEAVTELAARVSGWLALDPAQRREAGLSLAKRVDRALELGGGRPERDRRLARGARRADAGRHVGDKPRRGDFRFPE